MARIVAGSIEPGEMLPREIDLVGEYDVSRGVARETIRALEERGLVSVKHGIGAFVNPPDRWDTSHPDVLHTLAIGDSHGAVARESEELWCWLVKEAVHLAARRGQSRWISRMREAVAEMEVAYASSLPTTEFGEAAEPFYSALFMASPNRPFRGMAMRMLPLLSLMSSDLNDADQIRESVIPEYRILVSIIDSGDTHKAGAQLKKLLSAEGRSVPTR